MASEDGGSGEQKRSAGADLVIPGCAVAFTLYYFSTIIDMARLAKVTAFLIGSVLIFLCCLLFVKVGMAVYKGQADLSMKRLVEPVEALPRRLLLLGLTLGYIVLLPILGFTLTTFAFLSAGMLMLARGEGARFKLGLSAALAVGWFVLLVLIFERRFPLGWLDQWMKSLIKPSLDALLKASGGN